MRVLIRVSRKEQGESSVKSTTRGIIALILFTFLILAGSAYATPAISVQYNGADLPGNGYLAMNTPTITVTITPDAGVNLKPETFSLLLDNTNTGATLNGTTASYTVTSALSDSTHQLTIAIMDDANSTGTPTTHTFKVDTQDPTLTAAVAWSTSTANTQTLTASCTDAGSTCTVEYKVPSQNGGNYQTYTNPVSFSGTDETLTVRAKDALDHVSAEQPFTLNTDTTAPTFSVTVSSENNFTKDKTPTFTIVATDALSGLASATLKCSGGTLSTKTMTASPLAVEDFDVTTNGCPSTDGSRDVIVQVKDVAGNNAAEQTITVKYDGHAPDAPEDLDDTDVTSTQVSMDWSEADDPNGGSGIEEYWIYRNTENNFNDASKVGEVGANDDLEFTNTGLTACKDYFYWVTAKDKAGNESEESNKLEVTTEGCASDSSSNNNNNTTTSSGGGGGGGGSGTTCNVTFDIPANVYAGETITAKVSGNTYSNGYFRVTPDGKATVKIDQSGLAKNNWSGPYLIPSPVGIKLTFRFGADGCLSSVTRNVKDPATKNIIPVTTTTPTVPSENTIPVLQSEPTPKVSPATENVILLLDALPTFMGSAGFNAENTAMREGIASILNSWNYIKTVSVVPGPTEGKYVVRLTLSMENTTKNGSIKIVEDIPKSLAESASQLESNYPMTVLKDDPLVQFEISGLTEGQVVEVQIDGTQEYSIEKANEKAAEVAGDATTPSLLFASGVAGSAPNAGDGRPLVDITGLATGVGSVAPFVIGLIVFAGIILVSVRVVRGSVEGADNPILRSASGVERGGSRTLRAPTSIKGRKIWKKDDAN